MKYLIFVIVLFSNLAACAPESKNTIITAVNSTSLQSMNNSVEVIHNGIFPIAPLSKNRNIQIISEQQEYEEILLQYSSDKSETVDFELYEVMLLTTNEHDNSGFSVEIGTLVDLGFALQLNIIYHYPDSTCVSNPATNQPYLFLKFHKEVHLHILETPILNPC